jgi:SpoVK/Ycf46/Vps4 family AAA+-type ATPase
MAASPISVDEVFERRLTYPDSAAERRLARLVGIDTAIERLRKLLGVLLNPAGLHDWAKQNHPQAKRLIDLVETRPPLAILAGDVGTGKTALAENIGDAVARQEEIPVTLLPLSLGTRGSGRVGEMTLLLSAAFDQTAALAKKARGANGKAKSGLILLVDEADALTPSRASAQMHHEDQAGVNAFIRGVDRLAEQHLPAAVILCTNRLGSIDPAVQRRAAEVFTFSRPTEGQRRSVLAAALQDTAFTDAQLDELAALTGVQDGRDYSWTYSDLTQRLLPSLVLDAYPTRAITFERALEIIRQMEPTPPFRDRSH